MSPGLAGLRARVAREVWNVECERGPVTDHGGERGEKDGEKCAEAIGSGWAWKALRPNCRPHVNPDEQSDGHDEDEWRAEGLQVTDGFNAAPDNEHV